MPFPIYVYVYQDSRILEETRNMEALGNELEMRKQVGRQGISLISRTSYKSVTLCAWRNIYNLRV